jgi:hypothetical protein
MCLTPSQVKTRVFSRRDIADIALPDIALSLVELGDAAELLLACRISVTCVSSRNLIGVSLSLSPGTDSRGMRQREGSLCL